MQHIFTYGWDLTEAVFSRICGYGNHFISALPECVMKNYTSHEYNLFRFTCICMTGTSISTDAIRHAHDVWMDEKEMKWNIQTKSFSSFSKRSSALLSVSYNAYKYKYIYKFRWLTYGRNTLIQLSIHIIQNMSGFSTFIIHTSMTETNIRTQTCTSGHNALYIKINVFD